MTFDRADYLHGQSQSGFPYTGAVLMIRLATWMLLLTGMFWVGCNSTASANPSDYIGEYVFRPSADVPQQFANFIILKRNQEAVEIRFDEDTGQVQTKQEKWYLSRTTGQNLVIGNFSCSVEGSRTAIRLSVNDDLGQYYEKIR